MIDEKTGRFYPPAGSFAEPVSDDRPCLCGCGRKQRRGSWLQKDERMFATDHCATRWSRGMAICSCGREFAERLGGRVGAELLCPKCYETHPAIVGPVKAQMLADETFDDFQKARRA